MNILNDICRIWHLFFNIFYLIMHLFNKISTNLTHIHLNNDVFAFIEFQIQVLHECWVHFYSFRQAMYYIQWIFPDGCFIKAFLVGDWRITVPNCTIVSRNTTLYYCSSWKQLDIITITYNNDVCHRDANVSLLNGTKSLRVIFRRGGALTLSEN